VNRQPVKKPEDVAAAISKMKEGQIALLRIKRGDQTAFIAVPVGGRQ
jgi:serine protease Do